MLRPKASHLVERVAERLLRSGTLEESAAQLLEPSVEETSPIRRLNELGGSSLFASPSALPFPIEATVADKSRVTVSPLADPVSVSNAAQPPLGPPIPLQPIPLSPRDLTGIAEPFASDLVQGPPAVDALALERGGMVDWSRTRSRISEEFRLVQRQILRSAFGPGAEPVFQTC